MSEESTGSDNYSFLPSLRDHLYLVTNSFKIVRCHIESPKCFLIQCSMLALQQYSVGYRVTGLVSCIPIRSQLGSTSENGKCIPDHWRSWAGVERQWSC